MSEPAGQVRTEISSEESGTPLVAISSAREVEQGARSMLLLAEGMFRLDVIPHDDSVQAIVRGLAQEERAEFRFRPVGGAASFGAILSPPSTGRFGGEVVLLGERGERVVARVLVGSVCHLERGVTSFTAQATLL